MRQTIFLVLLLSNFTYAQQLPYDYEKNMKSASKLLDELKDISFTNYDSIQNCILQKIRLIDKFDTNEAQLLYAKLLNELSFNEYFKGKYIEAIEIQLKAQKIFESQNNISFLSKSYYRLGSYYIKLGNELNTLASKNEKINYQNLALTYLKKSYDFASKIDEKETLVQSITGLANYYATKNNVDSTHYYCQLILKNADFLTKSAKTKAVAYQLLGVITTKNNEHEKAEFYFKKAIDEATKGNSNITATLKNNLAFVLMKQKKFELAKKQVFELIPQNLEQKKYHHVSKNYATLYEIYKYQKKMDSVVYALEAYYQFNDSVVDQKHKDLLKELNIAYETEKKDAQITILKQNESIQNLELKQQKQKLYFAQVGFIIFVMIVMLIFYYQRKINKVKTLSLRSKLTRSQFNPHYINNAFTSLQATLIEHNLDENLINYTADVSRFSRLLLESTFKDEWTIFEEKQMMIHYLNTQKHRYENNFDFSIITNISSTDLQKYKIPSALTQCVLENAIEHGGYQLNTGGFIEIQLHLEQKDLTISIKNNIISNQNKSIKKLENTNSRGLEITEKRVLLHKKIYGGKSDFMFTKQNDEAIVQFVLPKLVA